jgi:predicted RNA-binding protein with PUA-like domain
MAPGYWLMKSEPDTFGIDDLARVGTEPWSGVRGIQARNYMRDQMQVGDLVLFYHSSVAPPGVAGLARVVRTGVVDETQFEPASPYFDPKSTREAPRWVCVEVGYTETLPRLVTLDELRANPALADMVVLRIGRLSVQPATAAEYDEVVAMSRRPAPPAAKKPAAKKAAKKAPAKKVPAPRKPPAKKPAAKKPAARVRSAGTARPRRRARRSPDRACRPTRAR